VKYFGVPPPIPPLDSVMYDSIAPHQMSVKHMWLLPYIESDSTLLILWQKQNRDSPPLMQKKKTKGRPLKPGGKIQSSNFYLLMLYQRTDVVSELDRDVKPLVLSLFSRSYLYKEDVKETVVLFVRVGGCYPVQQSGLWGTHLYYILMIVNCKQP
jgi:hypothetical protein